MMKQTDHTLLKNALVMTAVSVGLRTAGIYYRTQMTATVGAEGVGLYTLTQTAFLFAVTLATAGLHTAVTMVLAENAGQGVRRAIRGALGYALFMGLLAGGLLFFAAPFIADVLLNDTRCAPSLRILSPALPIMALAAVFKGFFFARRQAGFVALSDVLEQGVEMAAFFLTSERLVPLGLTWACASIAIGTVVSELASCTMLTVACRKALRREPVSGESALSRIRRTALPVTGSALLGAGLQTTENTLIPRGLLQYGLSRTEALSIYGQVRAMALPLIFYPSALIQSLSALMIPELSEARAAGALEKLYPAIRRLLRMTLCTAFLTAGLLWAFSSEIALAVFHNADIGRYLLLLSPLIPLMYLETIADGLLKGLDRQKHVLRIHLIDASVRAALVMVLVPRWGVRGFLCMMYVSNILSPLASVSYLLKTVHLRFLWLDWLVKPALSAGLAAAAARLGATVLSAGSDNILFLLFWCAVLCALFAGSLYVCRHAADNGITEKNDRRSSDSHRESLPRRSTRFG